MQQDDALPVRVMLSHTSSEEYLARAWQWLLVHGLKGLAPEEVWFSTDPSEPFGGDEGFAVKIEKVLKRIEVLLSIQTPCSAKKPWIVWEGAMARGLGKSTFVATYSRPGDPSLKGKLGTPLDAFDHKDGDLRKDVLKLLSAIGGKLKLPLRDTEAQEAALKTYFEIISPFRQCWRSRVLQYDKRLLISFGNSERNILLEKGTIVDTVEVSGSSESLQIFGFDGKEALTLDWRFFVDHLGAQRAISPWPGSACRWARCLSAPLHAAMHDRLLNEPEGLPLYFDPWNSRGYRPAIAERRDDACTTSFEITFTELPRELVKRPGDRIGILLHYVDFCRMMRWGVLESSQIREFFRNVASASEEQKVEALRRLIQRTTSIRTEFWNRGLEKDAILDAVSKDTRPAIEGLLGEYYEAIKTIDPDDLSGLRKPIPDVEQLRNAYVMLLRINKKIFELIIRELPAELASLRETL